MGITAVGISWASYNAAIIAFCTRGFNAFVDTINLSETPAILYARILLHSSLCGACWQCSCYTRHRDELLLHLLPRVLVDEAPSYLATCYLITSLVVRAFVLEPGAWVHGCSVGRVVWGGTVVYALSYATTQHCSSGMGMPLATRSELLASSSLR